MHSVKKNEVKYLLDLLNDLNCRALSPSVIEILNTASILAFEVFNGYFSRMRNA